MGSYSSLAVAATGITVLASFAGQRAKAGRRVTAVACNFDKTSQIGAGDPLGFFDPLDFCKDEASFKDLRGKELKHGRAAMMGAVGMLGQSLVQLPGMEDVPKDVSAAWTGNGATGMAITVVPWACLARAWFSCLAWKMSQKMSALLGQATERPEWPLPWCRGHAWPELGSVAWHGRCPKRCQRCLDRQRSDRNGRYRGNHWSLRSRCLC